MMLYEIIRDWQNTPFSWESANCCHFAKDVCVRQGRAVDIEVPSVAGPEEARAWLHEHGYRGLYGLLRGVLGNPVAPLQGKRGDLVLRGWSVEGGAIGVIDRTGLFLSERGLISVPLGNCRWAFRVGSRQHG